MTSETCPHCGAAADNVRCPGNDNWYACGTMESDPKDRGGKCYRNEISNLRSQNRDLQQAYDHVLECEQNRCREVVELQDQLKEVTAERDELLNRFRPLPNLQRQSTPTNCFRACVATVLGITVDDVPTACDGASWNWDEFQKWLSGRGMQAIEITFENGGTLYPVSSPVQCIVTGQSPRESTTGLHAVVGRFIGLAGFELVGDPHPSDLWIDGEPTHAVFFVPLWPTVVSDRDELRRRINEAPVAWRVEIIGGIYESEELAIAEAQPCGCGVTRVRILPEPEVIDA